MKNSQNLGLISHRCAEAQTQTHRIWSCALASLFSEWLRVTTLLCPLIHKRGYSKQFSFRSGSACVLLAFSGHRPETKSRHLRSDTQPVRDRSYWIHATFSSPQWGKPEAFSTHDPGSPVGLSLPTVAVAHSFMQTLLVFLPPLPHFHTLPVLS